MKLTPTDVVAFFTQMWRLQFYANQKHRVLPDIQTLEEYVNLPQSRRVNARDAVYDHPDIIDEYIAENPYGLSDEELAIIAGWKHFVRGEFYIERFLKKHTIFIAETNVYAVLGLKDPLDSMIPHTPAVVRTVLLPFKGSIVYDGIMQFHNIYFGGGIKRNLKEIYMTAKQNNRIVHTLEPGAKKQKRLSAAKPAQTAPDKNDLKNLQALAKAAEDLRGGSGKPPVLTPAFSLVRASIEIARTAVNDPNDPHALRESMKTLNRALGRLDKTVRRMR